MEQIEQNGHGINIKKMILMALAGFLLGLFLVPLVKVILGSTASTVAVIIITILFAYWGSKMKVAEPKKEEALSQSQDGLSKREKIITWVFSFLAPLIAGGVLYYTWIKTYPKKAKQANRISWIVFFIYIAIYVIRTYFEISK